MAKQPRTKMSCKEARYIIKENRIILDALKTDDPHEPSAHENEILL